MQHGACVLQIIANDLHCFLGHILAFSLSVGLREASCAGCTFITCLVHAVDVDPHQSQLTGVELTKVRLELRAEDHVDINLYTKPPMKNPVRGTSQATYTEKT